MALLDQIRERLGSPKSRFSYYCRECGTEFASPAPSRTDAECPNCTARGTRAITRR